MAAHRNGRAMKKGIGARLHAGARAWPMAPSYIPLREYSSQSIYNPVPSTFEILADANRRRILDALLMGPCAVGDLVDTLELPQPSVSKHLRVLKDARFVDVRQEAQRRVYSLCSQPLLEVDAWLEPYRRVWAKHLDALERHLNNMKDARPKPRRRKR